MWAALLVTSALSAVLGGRAEAAPAHGHTTSSAVFGVLAADPRYLAADHAAGLRLATISLCWDEWQPSSAAVNRAYRNEERRTVADYERAGFEVAIDIGLQCPPSWVLDLPDGQLVDQYGAASGTADFEFSAAVRTAAARYITEVVQALGPVTYYRVGLSAAGELLYPEAPQDNWWAFDPTAQASAPGLPVGVPPTPLPGWTPGTPTADGPATAEQVREWYDWYLGAEVNADRWEISTYRGAGFSGQLQLVVPGDGAKPRVYSARLAAGLADVAYDPFHTLNTGAVWQVVLGALAPEHNLVLDISSVGDGSGVPANNRCQPSDHSVPISSQAIADWSDTRWLTYLAGRDHLGVVGENPGTATEANLGTIFALVESCHLVALQWAFDDWLHDGDSPSLSAYAARIRTAGKAH